MRTATVFNFLVEATLIGSALMLVMLLARPFLRRRLGSRALFLAWVLVVLRLAAPLALPNPAMNWLRPTLSQDAGIRPMADQVRVRMEDAAFDLYWKLPGGALSPACSGTVIGARRVIPAQGVEAAGAVLVVRQSRGRPWLKQAGFYG